MVPCSDHLEEIDRSEPEPPLSGPPNGTLLPKKPKPSFHYDPDLFAKCKTYLEKKNYHGLALIARQKGIPPFLRFKVWPMLLKHHPYVLNPFLQPDRQPDSDENLESLELDELELKRKIRKDLRRYMHRVASPSDEPLLETELRLFDTLEKSVHKFIVKWGRIIKYDLSLSWFALGLAEWFPPIPHTSWVLLGRDVLSANNTHIGCVFDDYQEYIHSLPGLDSYLKELVQDENISNMSFHEVYERLVLILLHSPELANKRDPSKLVKIDKLTLPINGGTIEERVSFFIYVFQILLPELSEYFLEEQILNKFGAHDDEWLIWWLKFCGAKVWSRVDRGRVWDLLVGWRLQSKKSENNKHYYSDKLNISDQLLDKLGPDVFWTVDYEEDQPALPTLTKRDSFKDLMSELHIEPPGSNDSSGLESISNNDLPPQRNHNSTSSSSLGSTLPSLLPSLECSLSLSCTDDGPVIPFSKIDMHIELLFVCLALLQAKGNTLVELDQHEIRTFLSRLPAKSFKASDKYKQYQEQKDKEKGSAPPDSGFRYDYMDSIIYEAGELWRKWLWREQTS
ncbi:hypothetical protein C7M61_003517 [Candidozyma pseudohaemuli]|uniref:Rab-GAP TBC domain-containing protein n=1 Tax=Candidozyma pseudohaemuli TaxID=418784 RepID=A0A2P7YM98_9ASCO|nr:hypothetical protein C7M61_003517 [[Candida] pseudohaemulonii]PSK37090.1 hypothetical protein C7M61_003517 [[Candida] pseudohaemulonii]